MSDLRNFCLGGQGADRGPFSAPDDGGDPSCTLYRFKKREEGLVTQQQPPQNQWCKGCLTFETMTKLGPSSCSFRKGFPISVGKFLGKTAGFWEGVLGVILCLAVHNGVHPLFHMVAVRTGEYTQAWESEAAFIGVWFLGYGYFFTRYISWRGGTIRAN